jgi:inhibitor of KinA sporulation pathway (predicted exonuclease)
MTIDDLLHAHTDIVIFDTEYTTWEGALARKWSGDGEHRELVQLAAVKVNLTSKTVYDTFTQYAIPTINPRLSEYFTQLTGITQHDIETDGLLFQEVYMNFLTWVGDLSCFSYRNPQNHLGDAVVFQENMSLYNLEVPFPEHQFHNIRPIFDAFGVPTHEYNSGKLHEHFGITLHGHEHNAMHDMMSLTHSLFALY